MDVALVYELLKATVERHRSSGANAMPIPQEDADGIVELIEGIVPIYVSASSPPTISHLICLE